MKSFAVAALLLVLLVAQASTAATGPEKLSCPKNARISRLVKTNWYDNKDYMLAFAEFMKEPATAACYLIKELTVVPEKRIRGAAQPRYPNTMHVFWSVRALRYITGAKVPITGFFSVPRFSTDSLEVAPQFRQKHAIEDWVDWYLKHGATFEYEPAEGLDWYFYSFVAPAVSVG